MALTTDQLADFQADLGVDDSEAVFTDVELNRLFDRAESDYNTAVFLAWRQLLAAATKYIDYRVAQTEEKRAQVFAHIQKMVVFWAEESRTAANQMKIVGMADVPTRRKEEPAQADSERRKQLRRSAWR